MDGWMRWRMDGCASLADGYMDELDNSELELTICFFLSVPPHARSHHPLPGPLHFLPEHQKKTDGAFVRIAAATGFLSLIIPPHTNHPSA